MLDWKITDAPGADESPSAAAPHPTRRRLPRAAWILVGSVITLAIAGAGLYSWWTRVNTQQAVQQALAQEASVVGTKDAAQIKTLYGSDDSDWDKAHTRWALDGQAAPRPLPFLYPLTTTGQLTALEPFAPNVLRAEIARPFSNTQGQVLTFTTTYFYAFNAQRWQRIAPPAGYWGEQRLYVSPYLSITYWEPDQALVDEVGPFLSNVLAQVCAEWDCPADYKFELHLTETLPNPFSLAGPPADALPTDPLFFDVLLAFRLYVREPVFRMASPRIMGYPTDSASRAYFRRALGWQVIGRTLGHLGYRATRDFRPLLNPLHFGLLTEIGVQLGLDSAPTDAPLPINDLTALDWLGQSGNTMNLTNSGARAKLRAAYALVHQLLRDEPPEAGTRLLRAMWDNDGGVGWIETGLGLSPAAAQARFDAALREAVRIQSRVSGRFDWAVSCAAGPAVLALDEGEVRYLLTDASASNNFLYGSPVAWAADGRQLFISGHGLLADLSTGRMQWAAPPATGYPDRLTFLDDDLIAYLLWAYAESSPRSTLHFQNLSDPLSAPPAIEEVWDYAASPDGQWIALTQRGDADTPQTSPNISVIPSSGGPPILTTEGAFPAWSPDGTKLVYTKYNLSGRFTAFYSWDAETGEARELINRNSFSPPLEATYAQAVWSPDGEWLAVVAGSELPNNQLWLIRPDGSDPQILYASNDYVAPPRFSADGEFLAAVVYPPTSNGELQILRVPSGEIVPTTGRGLRAFNTFDWSPTGHRLALAAFDGLYLLTDPAAEPQRLNETSCYWVAWNPTR